MKKFIKNRKPMKMPKDADKGKEKADANLSPKTNRERKAERRAAYLAESTERQGKNIKTNKHKD